jgi:hypothetical protein
MRQQFHASLLLIGFVIAFFTVDARGAVNDKDYAEGKMKAVAFRASLRLALSRRALKTREFCDESDAASRRVLRDYGAVFLADETVLSPPVCIFSNEQAVADFQNQITVARAEIEGATIELQNEAMNSLLAARAEAIAAGLNITPRDGAEAARRDYADTVRLWNSRFFPALKHWQTLGALNESDAQTLAALPIRRQIAEVLKLEERGVFFSRDFSKSILYSVAAPGTSQHLSLLALDVNEYASENVRQILARHGWFRTVKNDAPHFTYLGFREKDLPRRGLRRITSADGEFWIPNMP